MCGCMKHHTPERKCTCICPEHRNFELALKLAEERFDLLRDLREDKRSLIEADRDGYIQALQDVLDRADEGIEFGPEGYLLVSKIVNDVKRRYEWKINT